MKIGAGHKPQGYDERGRYTGPGGGQTGQRDFGGRSALSQDEQAGGLDEETAQQGQPEKSAEELEEELEALEAARQQAQDGYKELDGVQIADSGQSRSDAGDLSGGTEVRGPVTKPEATVTWKNDEQGKLDPKFEDLSPKTQQTVERMKSELPNIDSFDVNSGKRPGAPELSQNSHVQARAVDINKINGERIKDVMQGGDAAAKERLKQRAAEIEAWARANRDVEMVITPFGGVYRYPNDKTRDASSDEVASHWNHIHIQTRKEK